MESRGAKQNHSQGGRIWSKRSEALGRTDNKGWARVRVKRKRSNGHTQNPNKTKGLGENRNSNAKGSYRNQQHNHWIGHQSHTKVRRASLPQTTALAAFSKGEQEIANLWQTGTKQRWLCILQRCTTANTKTYDRGRNTETKIVISNVFVMIVHKIVSQLVRSTVSLR